MNTIQIWTGGQCVGNPGVGGWAFVVRRGDDVFELSGISHDTTTQRMELTAAINALQTIDAPSRVVLYSNSEYVVKGITQWIHNWIKHGWTTRSHKSVSNRDLWEKLYALSQDHEIEWKPFDDEQNPWETARIDELLGVALSDVQKIAESESVPLEEACRQAEQALQCIASHVGEPISLEVTPDGVSRIVLRTSWIASSEATLLDSIQNALRIRQEKRKR